MAGPLALVSALSPLSNALVLLEVFRAKLRARPRRVPGEPVPGPPAAAAPDLPLTLLRMLRVVAVGAWCVLGGPLPGHFLGVQRGAELGGAEPGPVAGCGFSHCARIGACGPRTPIWCWSTWEQSLTLAPCVHPFGYRRLHVLLAALAATPA